MAKNLLMAFIRILIAVILIAVYLAMYPTKQAQAAVAITTLGTNQTSAGTSPWTALTGKSLTANDYVIVAEAGDSATSGVQVNSDPAHQDQVVTFNIALETYTTTWKSQSFTATASYTITSISLRLSVFGTMDSQHLHVRLYNCDANDKPTGSILTEGYILNTSITTAKWYSIPVSSYDITNTTKYVIVVYDDIGDASNNIYIYADDRSVYATGKEGESSDSGSTWTVSDTRDICFGLGGIGANYITLSNDVTATNSGNVVAKIWSGKITVTSTSYYIVITNTSTSKAMAAYKVSGLADNPFDGNTANTATGTGTSRAVNTAANPTNAGDLVIVGCGIEQHSDDGAGTWESDTANDAHANAQFDGTTGGGSAANICIDAVADVTDNNTTVEHGHNTGPTSADYAIAIATYKVSTDAYTLSNTPSSKAFGVVAASTTYYAKGTAPSNPVVDGDCTYSVSNDGASAFKINIHGHNFTGGVGWTLGTPAENVARIIAYYSGQNPASGVTVNLTDQVFYPSLNASAHLHWDFSLETPSNMTDGTQKQMNITISAVAP